MPDSTAPTPESPLDMAKRLAARAESDDAKVDSTLAQRQLLQDEVHDFEAGKRGAQAEHDDVVQQLAEQLAAHIQLFDAEINERLTKIAQIDERLMEKGVNPPATPEPDNSGSTSNPVPAGKKATPPRDQPAASSNFPAPKLVEKAKKLSDKHPAATSWLKRLASSPSTDTSKYKGRDNL